MIIFFVPLIVVLLLSGSLIGFVVGRRAWGYVGATYLAMALGLGPAIVFLAGVVLCLRFELMLGWLK